jgi:hypothetical protein
MTSRISTLLTLLAFAGLSACADDRLASARSLTAPEVSRVMIANSTSPSTMSAPTCTGEVLVFTGTLHTETHATTDKAGGFHFGMHINGEFRAVGVTGINYLLRFEENLPVNANNGANESSFAIHERVLSTGKTPNLLFDLHLHTTTDANGEPTAHIDDVREECRG